MRQTRAIELGTGLFVLLGFAALFFLVTQITSREFGLGSGGYRVTASFDQIGSLKPGAPVSMPLAWSKVTKRLDPARFTIRTAPALLAKEGDPFAGVLGKPVDVPALLRALSARLDR